MSAHSKIIHYEVKIIVIDMLCDEYVKKGTKPKFVIYIRNQYQGEFKIKVVIVLAIV